METETQRQDAVWAQMNHRSVTTSVANS